MPYPSSIPRKLSQGDDVISVFGQPSYQIAGLDLSSLWIDLVRQNKVSASMGLPSNETTSKDSGGDGTKTMVEYGVRMVEKSEEDADSIETTKKWVFEDYVEQKGLDNGELESSPDPVISNIITTLARTQKQTKNGSGVKFQKAGNFVAQLQLVRTLRPPPSEGFLEATTSTPPPYNPEKDSFVTGPLRLELRPLVARLELSGCDDNSNDRRGHFLLLPSLMDKDRNWRGQQFTKDDCHDLVHLTSTIGPAGSVFLGYNSVGAGASQNHIHCHSWPYPTMDSKHNGDTGAAKVAPDADCLDGDFEYAVANVGKIYDFYDIFDGKVEVSYLNYPVFCIQMSSSVENLDLLGKAVATCLESIGEAPHNIGFLNRISRIEEEALMQEGEQQRMVDVFLFVRSKETSSFLPTSKLGVSEMMGVFHAQSEAELDTLATMNTVTNEINGEPEQKCVMEQALADVSFVDDEALWENIMTNLSDLEADLTE
eukprot:jgi/Psemu1/250907/estExt_Genewise1Plus.C_220041